MVSPVRLLLALHLAAVAYALFQMAQTRHDTWFISSAAGVAAFSPLASSRMAALLSNGRCSNVTEFYLWMSFGGVLGGLFAALIAPKICPRFSVPVAGGAALDRLPAGGDDVPARPFRADVGAGGRRIRSHHAVFGALGGGPPRAHVRRIWPDAGAGGDVRSGDGAVIVSGGTAAWSPCRVSRSDDTPFQRPQRIGRAQLLRRLSRADRDDGDYQR